VKTIAKPVTVFDVYQRAKTGSKVEEREWDFKIIPQTAKALAEKYDIKMDKKTIVPEDRELIDKLWEAGLELLVTCGVYSMDTGRVIKYTRDEVLTAITAAPDHFIFGEGKEATYVVPRSYDSSRPPIIQGGPTGSPCSEEAFLSIHQAYAQEPIVDTIVDGVMQTVMGYDPTPGSPWELMAVHAEIDQVREAMTRAGRTGMGL
jgi:methylamine--corrinoid protein Co-methyltransferase